ncbi:MAG: Rieske (2Fe-2S) protein [Oligoflexia bacterium]|nr:Rieske (2Fe-2S) protein [Oligoflexia bacterium]
MERDPSEGGCSRRGVMCGFSALSVLGLAGMSPLVACSRGGSRLSPTGGTGSTSGTVDGTADGGGTDSGGGLDTGASVCDASNVACINLADSSNADALGSLGDFGFLSIEGDTLIIINIGDGAFDVLSAICTHQGCRVSYRKGHDDIICRCHYSYFDMDGNVTAGPAPRPLKQYSSEIQGDILVISI